MFNILYAYVKQNRSLPPATHTHAVKSGCEMALEFHKNLASSAEIRVFATLVSLCSSMVVAIGIVSSGEDYSAPIL